MSLEKEQEKIERIYIDLENELLLNIAKKISSGKPMEIDKWDESTGQPIYGSGGVNEWQLERLKELNGLNKQNAKIIAKYSGKTVKEIEKIFNRAKEIGTEVNRGILDLGIKAGVLNEVNPKTEEEQVSFLLNSAIQEVLTTFNKQNNSLLASAGEEYLNIVNKVSSQVLAGTKTVEKAMQEAVSQLAEKGLTGFVARNGAKWTPEAYTKMVLRANTQNLTNRIQDEQMRLSGCDYIAIDQHSGARPKCSRDQGQIFSLSGNQNSIVDGKGKKIKVRDWSTSSYGQPDGILGINCGHSRRPFVPGVSIHRDEPIPQKENDEDYLEKQKQRLYERTIRKNKREIAMLKQTKAEDSFIRMKQNNLSTTRKEYLEFLDKTGRTRITANEWIGSTSLSPKNETEVQKNKNENKQLTDQDIKFITDWVSSDSYKINDLLRYNRKISSEWKTKIDGINSAIKKMPKYEGTLVRVLEIKDINTFLKDYKIDNSIKYKEFLSFSTKEGYNNNANVKIYVVSKNGRDIRNFNADESEILYSINSSFIVRNIQQRDGIVYILLEEKMMKIDKMHDIPKAFPDKESKVKPQTKEERLGNMKKLLDIMLQFKDIDKKTYEKMYKEEKEKIEQEFSTK